MENPGDRGQVTGDRELQKQLQKQPQRQLQQARPPTARRNLRQATRPSGPLTGDRGQEEQKQKTSSKHLTAEDAKDAEFEAGAAEQATRANMQGVDCIFAPKKIWG